ncbi:hypothetical protein EYR38_003123 [Pleurotus pulmonarius]|nr:hypothetical protein EYR38_003123 [Pleurotus pulmonarius]
MPQGQKRVKLTIPAFQRPPPTPPLVASRSSDSDTNSDASDDQTDELESNGDPGSETEATSLADNEDEDEPEDEDEDELEAELAKVIPQKRKPGRPKQDELALPVSRRSPTTSTLQFMTGTSWSIVEESILKDISDAIKSRPHLYTDFTVMATVPRLLPKPGLPLMSDKDYVLLIQRALEWKIKEPTINLAIHQRSAGPGRDDKENETLSSSGGKETKRKKKLDPMDLPGNRHKAENAASLMDRWKCPKPTSDCFGTACWVDPVTHKHFPLNNERIEVWSSAMLKGPEFSTLTKPPNHRLFDSDGSQSHALSPVLQRRLDTRNAEKNTPPMPIINLGLGDLFRGTLAPPSIQNPPPHTPHSSLMPPGHSAGLGMTIEHFCLQYQLSAKILARFVENAYADARHLRFVTLEELRTMGFVFGEVAAIRDAVEQWSVRSDD